MENLHSQIYEKLDFFYKNNQIPHIIFHGTSGSGKKTIVNNFLEKIYDGNRNKIKYNVMFVNCSHGKGIKFIREDLKFFAKTNLQMNQGVRFKSIVLFNADSLTTDAQSALRRCIELFSYNTRFFIIVENKHKLLNPILSRFCDIYVPEYIDSNGNIENLHSYHLKIKFFTDIEKKREFLKEKIRPIVEGNDDEGLKAPKQADDRLVPDATGTMLEGQRPGDVKIIVETPEIKHHTKFEDIRIDMGGENLRENCDFCLRNFVPPPKGGMREDEVQTHCILSDISIDIYENGYSALDLIDIICDPEEFGCLSKEQKSQIRMKFHSIKSEFRCEKLLILYILNNVIGRLNTRKMSLKKMKENVI